MIKARVLIPRLVSRGFFSWQAVGANLVQDEGVCGSDCEATGCVLVRVRKCKGMKETFSAAG